MFSTSALTELEFVEIKLISHQFTLEEHLIAQKALQMYTPGIWIPIGLDVFSPDIQNQKRKSYQETYQLFETYTSKWAFSSEELELVKKALKHFISLPLPLYGSLHAIRDRKRDRKLAIRILSYLI